MGEEVGVIDVPNVYPLLDAALLSSVSFSFHFIFAGREHTRVPLEMANEKEQEEKEEMSICPQFGGQAAEGTANQLGDSVRQKDSCGMRVEMTSLAPCLFNSTRAGVG
jgi:hypothetical protein